MSDYGDNIWGELEDFGDGVSGRRLVRSGDSHLVAAVWEFQPRAEPMPYHLHHGTDEYLLVLRGTPTLRTPEGERELPEGAAVQFPRGRAGAHQLINRSDGAVRVVIAAYHDTPEVIEYPDEGTVAVGSRTPGHDGEPLDRQFPPEG
ncbi:MAG: cupin domain-containing protein [Gaiellaceae bacterium]